MLLYFSRHVPWLFIFSTLNEKVHTALRGFVTLACMVVGASLWLSPNSTNQIKDTKAYQILTETGYWVGWTFNVTHYGHSSVLHYMLFILYFLHDTLIAKGMFRESGNSSLGQNSLPCTEGPQTAYVKASALSPSNEEL